MTEQQSASDESSGTGVKLVPSISVPVPSSMHNKHQRPADEVDDSEDSKLGKPGTDSSYATDNDGDNEDKDTEDDDLDEDIEHTTNVTSKSTRRGKMTEAEKEAKAEKKIKKTKVEFRKDIAKKNEKLREARELQDRYKTQLRVCQRENREYKERLKASESSRLRMTDEIFQRVGATKQYFESDEQVTRGFTKLFEAVNSWTKKHAASNEQVHRELFATAARNLCNEEYCPGFASPKMKKAIAHGQVHPFVIVAAAVNQFLAVDVFDNPFQFLKDRVDGEQVVRIIEWLISVAAIRGSESDSIKARIFLMKLCTLTVGEIVSGQAGEHFKEISELKDQASLRLCQTLADEIDILLKPATDQMKTARKEYLAQIIREAFDLSCRLAVQHSNVELEFLRQMKQERFKMDHAKFDCHRARKIDDNVPSSKSPHYRKSLDMVIQPMVVRGGNADGTRLGKGEQRILVKAIIWMVKDTDIAPGGAGVAMPPRKKAKRSNA